MNNLKSIGFYTLEDYRAKHVSEKTPLWRCELILTDRCNFNCPYCRGVLPADQGDLSFDEACQIVDLWCSDGLKNIRFSGGEPTLWNRLSELVAFSKSGGVERIAVSTNGSADLDLYMRLIESGVNDFSISLDSCCSSTAQKMAGNIDAWGRVVANIKTLSSLTYTTIGVVITQQNEHELDGIISFASGLGVADIRIITAAQTLKNLPPVNGFNGSHPILSYRLSNFKRGIPIRGIGPGDNHYCPLVLDDMAILNGKHYPCIIYLREHGDPIGVVSSLMRKERKRWFLKHDCYADSICRNNCLDVCVAYNNRVRELNTHLTTA